MTSIDLSFLAGNELSDSKFKKGVELK